MSLTQGFRAGATLLVFMGLPPPLSWQLPSSCLFYPKGEKRHELPFWGRISYRHGGARMLATVGVEGLEKSWQGDFPLTVKCSTCGDVAHHAFTAHEGLDEADKGHRILRVTDLPVSHENDEGLWPRDFCAVAVYICPECLESTAVMNQA